jgi:hypothetical protein
MGETKVNETKPSETKPKKMVSRSVAIALGIVCILLIAGLGGAMAYYVSTHGHTDSDYDSLNSQNTNLDNIVKLANSTVWVNNQTISQPQDSWYNWTFTADYAGYASVQVHNSTILNPLAEAVYSYHGVNYDQQMGVGTIEGSAIVFSAYFPIMPSTIVIRVGNGPHVPMFNASGPTLIIVTETVTITYYY